MKRSVLYFALVLAACGTEKGVKSGKPATFIRYYNGGNNDYAVAMEPTSDGGYIILANSQGSLDLTYQKIKLIKTDAYGNEVWQQIYPTDDSAKYQAHALLILPQGGYVLVGEHIQQSGIKQSLLVTVDDQGAQPKYGTYNASSFPNQTAANSAQGLGITLNTNNGNFLILSSTDNNTNNMALAEIDKDDFSLVWSRTYGAGTVSLANKLLLDAQSNAVWCGTVTKGANPSSIRFLKTALNDQNALTDPTIDPLIAETGNDICQWGGNYAIIGSTHESATSTTTNILYKLLLSDGSQFVSKVFVATEGTLQLSIVGNSISTTSDGGFIILGTVSNFGRGGTDYYLIKSDIFGNELWKQVYGSKLDDTGVSVRAVSDGGYAVLGTTLFGGIPTVMLMKTDQNGAVQ